MKAAKNKNGFSIGEVIISMFVISVGIVAAIELLSNSIIHSIDSRNAVVASELAQEGVELVRNIRDENIALGNEAFNNSDFPDSHGTTFNNCRIDKDNITLPNSACSSPWPNTALTLRYDGNYYVQCPNPCTGISQFQRKVKLEYLDFRENSTTRDRAESMKVTSTVVWQRQPLDFPVPADCTIGNNCVSVDIILMDRWDW